MSILAELRAVFRDYLEDAFGVNADASLGPAEVARRLVQNWILAEAAELCGVEAFPNYAKVGKCGWNGARLMYLFAAEGTDRGWCMWLPRL